MAQLVRLGVMAAMLLGWLLAGVTTPQAGFGSFEPLTIRTAGGTHAFSVEVMRTPAEMSQGMMFRRSLDADKGMLFALGEEREAVFWMKNTYVPLDMVFIRRDGTIHRVEANTEPLSTRTISSGGPVWAVLEVPAGTAARRGFGPGDRVEHPIFAAE